MQQLPGVIIGGGIAGLTAALALRQQGLAVPVYEAAPQLLPLGAGIWLAPNAMQVFDRLGMAERLNAAGMPLHHIEIVDAQLRPLLRTNQARVRQHFGHGTTAISRAALQQLLAAQVGADLWLGKACVGLLPDAHGVTVHFADGSAVRAGFVVAADGVHSPIRGQLFPGVQPRATRHVVWRGVARLCLAPPFRQGIREAWGAGLRFGFSEIAPAVVDWFAAVPDGFGAERAGLRARLQAAFVSFADPVPALLAATPEAAILYNLIRDLPPLPAWHRGRVCLIGDAAHATTPYLGQGGCQGVADAYALALSLGRQPHDPPAAFAAMQRLRRAPAHHAGRTARLVGRVGYWTGAAGALRNLVLRATPAWVTERQFYRVYRLGF